MAVERAGKVGTGAGRQFLCRLLANGGPGPGLLFFSELAAPVLLHQACGLLRVVVGQANQGQHRPLFLVAAASGFFQQKPRRAAADVVNRFAGLGRDDLGGLARQAGPVVLNGQPGFAPDIGIAELLGGMQLRRRKAAALVRFFLPVPKAPDLPRQGCGIGLGVAAEGIASQLAVIVHAVAGQVCGKAGPVSALALQEQPVDAQAVFLVGVGVAVEKSLYLGAGGAVKPRPQFPKRRPGFQGVPPCLRQQGTEPFAVALLEGLAHVEQDFVFGRFGRQWACASGAKQK